MTLSAPSSNTNFPIKNSTLKAKKNKSFKTSKKISLERLATDNIEIPTSHKTSKNEQDFMREKIMGENDSAKSVPSSNFDSLTIYGHNNESEGDSDDASEGEEISITQRSTINENATISEKVLEVSEAPGFKPPDGFRPQTSQENSFASHLFSESNLMGKQIWCLEVPSNLDIKCFENVLTSKNLTGENIISTDSDEFEISKNQLDSQNLRILAFEDKKKGYRFVPKTVSQKICLSQVLRNPSFSSSETKTSKARIMKPYGRPPRSQPKGLKMRFHHIGFDAGNLQNIGNKSSSDSSDDAQEVTISNFSPSI